MTDKLRAALEEAAQSLESISTQAGTSVYLSDISDVRAYARSRAMVARAALAEPEPAAPELGDRFMEILRAIHGDMPDDFADSARLAFVHATKALAEPVVAQNATTAAPVEQRTLSDEELARIAYKGFNDYWTDNIRCIESEAWAAGARAVLATQEKQ